jgi:cytochrome c553
MGLMALAALALAGTASADGIGDESAPPQERCGLCHGIDGVSRMAKFPRLAGQKAAYIEKQLRDFREGRRTNDGGQMEAIVTEIAEEQFSEVAAYFAALPPPPPVQAESGDAAAGRRLFHKGDAARGIAPCASCHLPGSAQPPAAAALAPHLSAQHPSYLVKQLTDFRQGARDNDGAAGMAATAKVLSDEDVAALAAYLSATPRTPAHAD